MKARVIRAFIDKKTGKPYNAGTVFEGTSARLKELASKGFLSEVISHDSNARKH